ncbi:DUF1015 family protein [Lewinella sp. W8]|uniref:DUF1015 family protein n=1 Tax=Lewinella sp. W8 TaxID=2528208 RepID=UPI001068C7F8|nr:DUF1015 family protein [Lewinella sp. W8]MTB53480.1 DUF1015 family protein [Lewinella sp. W8]
MSLYLHPFPHHHHAPDGLQALPYTRNGVRQLPAGTFLKKEYPTFKELYVTRHFGGSCRGICGLLPSAAFLDGTVKPHEQTLNSRLARQRELIIGDGGALAKPILLLVPSLKDWWADTPEATGNPVRFAGIDNDYVLQDWAPEGPIRPVPLPPDQTICIADGHHRAESHARLASGQGPESPFYWLPVVIMGADEVRVDTFLRIIEPPDWSPAELLDKLRPFFSIEPVARPRPPQQTGDWLLAYRCDFYHLSRREATDDTDSGWLNATVLPAVFGITDTRSDERISSVYHKASPDGPVLFPEGVEGKIILRGFPLPEAQFFREIAANRCLPPKSTRFEPRVPSGLLVWIP